MDPPPEKPAKESEFWEPYAQAAKTVRAWFLAFGIGAPAVFVTNKEASDALVNSGYARLIVIFFLGGVAIQVAIGLTYKHAMSYLYLCEGDDSAKCRRVYKALIWITEAFWLEVTLDVVTFGLFVAATAIAMCALIP